MKNLARKWTLIGLIVWLAAIVVMGISAWLIVDLILQGGPHLSLLFLILEPFDSGRAGGIGPVLVSTGLILLVCLAVSLPLGVGSALFLSEFSSGNSLLGRLIRSSINILSGVPSIVFGLFGSAFFCNFLGLGFSIAAGGLTLSCMVLPLLIRAGEEGFSVVSETYRLNAAALGLSKARTIWALVIPQAFPGLMVGLVLAIGRALSETAALIFTSGYVARFPGSLLDSGRSLSVHVFDLAMHVPGGEGNAYASALVLTGTLLILNALVALLRRRFSPKVKALP